MGGAMHGLEARANRGTDHCRVPKKKPRKEHTNTSPRTGWSCSSESNDNFETVSTKERKAADARQKHRNTAGRAENTKSAVLKGAKNPSHNPRFFSLKLSMLCNSANVQRRTVRHSYVHAVEKGSFFASE